MRSLGKFGSFKRTMNTLKRSVQSLFGKFMWGRAFRARQLLLFIDVFMSDK